jgi:hypothetical protein
VSKPTEYSPRSVAYHQQLMAAVTEARRDKAATTMAEGIGRLACAELPDVSPIDVGRVLALLGAYMGGFNHRPPHPTYEPVAMILGGMMLAPGGPQPPMAEGSAS